MTTEFADDMVRVDDPTPHERFFDRFVFNLHQVDSTVPSVRPRGSPMTEKNTVATTEDDTARPLVQESLVEDVSIDGMCGVY